MTRELRGAVSPRLRAWLTGTRHGAERPDELAGVHVERPNVTGRIALEHEPIGDMTPDHDEILVNDGRRPGLEVQGVDRSIEPLRQIHDAVVSEGLDELAGLSVESQEFVPRVHEDPALLAVAPSCHPAVNEPEPGESLPDDVRLRIVLPYLFPGRGIERYHAAVCGTQVQHAVDHDRCGLELTGLYAVLLARAFARIPFPRDLERPDVASLDLLQGRVLGRSGVGGVVGPLLCDGGRSDDPTNKHTGKQGTVVYHAMILPHPSPKRKFNPQ